MKYSSVEWMALDSSTDEAAAKMFFANVVLTDPGIERCMDMVVICSSAEQYIKKTGVWQKI